MSCSLLHQDIRALKKAQVAAILLWLVLSVAIPVWWTVKSSRRREMQNLYASASGGNSASLEQLAQYSDPEAKMWIVKLAQDHNAFAEARVHAIEIIARRPSLDTTALAPLLWVEEPFIIRHTAALAFLTHGCDENCMEATLYAVHALLQGTPTNEVTNSARLSEGDRNPEFLAELRKETLTDYVGLLNRNPCLAWKTLKRDYNSESEFVRKIGNKLAPC